MFEVSVSHLRLYLSSHISQSCFVDPKASQCKMAKCQPLKRAMKNSKTNHEKDIFKNDFLNKKHICPCQSNNVYLEADEIVGHLRLQRYRMAKSIKHLLKYMLSHIVGRVSSRLVSFSVIRSFISNKPILKFAVA